ncbi:MAG: CDP-alcohol phosphatidyltransferase family protein, partial [Nocardioidaceae bacterium]
MDERPRDASEAPVPPVSNLNIANALTVLRIALVPVLGWLLLTHGGDVIGYRVAAFVVFVLAMVTDRIDGDIARSRGLVTNFGKIADPIADKALTGMAFVGLSVIGVLWWWVTIVVLVREWGITLMRFVVMRYGVMPASRGGKIKTTLQAVALGGYLL